MGATTRLSISAGSAPGHATMTSTIGTRICGSPPRGGARRARAPRPREAAMTSGVSLLSRKKWATLPAKPALMLLPPLGDGGAVGESGRVDDHPLSRLDAGADLNAPAVEGAGGHPAEAGRAIAHHEDPGESAPFEERGRGHGQAG